MSEERAVYDGFISYSHAADDLLAPRLQAGLQKFAKPWWKRRAVRIFRDESSLSANPHLWSSITEALDTSGWFVLLLSPDAAASEWVNQEVAYWVEHRDAKKILPVVTAGEFGWASGDVMGDAVPDALRGVFEEEPRWVDVRWAKDDDQLDLQDPRFADAVADIASTIRGIPKDDLASEEVRQHRRTVRTAWAAGGLVAVLAIAAVGFGLQSARNASEAQRQAALAAEQAVIAELNAEEAQRNAERADAEAAAEVVARERADLNARLARSRELAASAIAVLDSDPELATLLALEAIRSSPGGALPVALENALWTAGVENRLVAVYDAEPEASVAVSPDGSTLAVRTAPDELTGLDAFTGEVLWTYQAETTDRMALVAWGPGGQVAVEVYDSDATFAGDPTAVNDGLPNRVIIVNGETGSPVEVLEFPDCATAGTPAWSPDGLYLAISSGEDRCIRTDVPVETERWVEVFDTTSWGRVAFLPVAADFGPVPRWDAAGTLHGTLPFTEIPRWAPSTFEPMPSTGATGIGDVTSDGFRYFTSSSLAQGGSTFAAHAFDAETGQGIDVIYNEDAPVSIPVGVEVTPDDRYVIVGTVGSFTHVYEVGTFREVAQLPTKGFYTSAYDPASERLYTTSAIAGVFVWDLSVGQVGVEETGDLGVYEWVNGSGFRFGRELGAMDTIEFTVDEDGRPEASWAAQIFDLSTGELVGEPLVAVNTLGPNSWIAGDRLLVTRHDRANAAIWDPASGTWVELMECELEVFDDFGDPYCGDEGEPGWYWYVPSADGTELWAFGSKRPFDWESAGDAFVLDPTTGAIVEETTLAEFGRFHESIEPIEIGIVFSDWILGRFGEAWDRWTGDILVSVPRTYRVELSPSSGLAAFAALERIRVYDTATWEEVLNIEGTGLVRGLSFSPDEGRLVVGAADAVFVVDLATGLQLQQVNLPGVSDFHWMDDETVLVGTKTGVFGTLSLSTEDFLADVRSGLRRTFTEQECLIYGIDPCPTLEEMKSR